MASKSLRLIPLFYKKRDHTTVDFLLALRKFGLLKLMKFLMQLTIYTISDQRQRRSSSLKYQVGIKSMSSTEPISNSYNKEDSHQLNCSQDRLSYFDKEKSRDNLYFYNELHRAIYEGDIEAICTHIDWFRKKGGKPSLTDTQHHDVTLFYKNYLVQHPPDGVLRMAQFINAVLERFS